MAAFSRVSPAALTETLDVIGAQTARFFESVGLDAPSLGVAWAGIDPAPMWLDSARDFTAFWTHRQQIRHAVGLPTDQDPTSLSVVLDTFMRAVPHTLRTVDVPPGTQVRLGGRRSGGRRVDGHGHRDPLVAGRTGRRPSGRVAPPGHGDGLAPVHPGHPTGHGPGPRRHRR
ncbi:hypothetical protein [Streptomyces mobaraensis]|uniref:hypothetical protein n=1 Tax=Streptomyces mobaraensis TaxID=35621 RepID=UPI003F4D1D5D